MPPEFLAYLVILCFEKQRPKQKLLAQSQTFRFLQILPPKEILGWLRHCWMAAL